MERKAREAGALSCLADAAYSSDHFRCYEFKARTAGRPLVTVRLPAACQFWGSTCWGVAGPCCATETRLQSGCLQGVALPAGLGLGRNDGRADSQSDPPGPSGSQLAQHVLGSDTSNGAEISAGSGYVAQDSRRTAQTRGFVCGNFHLASDWRALERR